MSDWIETKVDPGTLPNDGAKVQYLVEGDQIYSGVFDAEPEMFWTSPQVWASACHVVKWRCI